MSLHEIPENLDPVNVAGAEGVVVTIVSIALDHLLLINKVLFLAVMPLSILSVPFLDWS